MTNTETLIANALLAEKFGRKEMTRLRRAFRSAGVTHETVRSLVSDVATQCGATRYGDAGRRVRDIWVCV